MRQKTPHTHRLLSCLARGEALLKSLHRAAECVVLHKRLAGLLTDLLLFVHRVGRLFSEAMTLNPEAVEVATVRGNTNGLVIPEGVMKALSVASLRPAYVSVNRQLVDIPTENIDPIG